MATTCGPTTDIVDPQQAFLFEEQSRLLRDALKCSVIHLQFREKRSLDRRIVYGVKPAEPAF